MSRRQKSTVEHDNFDSWFVGKWFGTLIRLAGWWDGRRLRRAEREDVPR